MKTILARWPKLERRGMRKLATVVFGMCLVWVVLALALGLSGCAVKSSDTESAYWKPAGVSSAKTNTDLVFRKMISGCERSEAFSNSIVVKAGCGIIVYECSANEVRITPNTALLATWMPRKYITPDVCLNGQP